MIKEINHIQVISSFFKNNYNKILILIFLSIIFTFASEYKKKKETKVNYSTYEIYFNKTAKLGELLLLRSLSQDFIFFLQKKNFQGKYEFTQSYAEANIFSFRIIHNSKDKDKVKELHDLVEEYKTHVVFKINTRLNGVTTAYEKYIIDAGLHNMGVLNTLANQLGDLKYFRDLLSDKEVTGNLRFQPRADDHVIFHYHKKKLKEIDSTRQSLTKSLLTNLLICFFVILLLLWFRILIWEFRRR